MNKIDELFKLKRKDILSVYFTAGYPSLDSATEILFELEKQGVDLVEIGMPFSDPLADGPVIQESSRIALGNGMSIATLFEQLNSLRLPASSFQLPIVLMGYINPVLQFGMKEFLDQCLKCKISGVILPDLPVEVYEEEFKILFEDAGVYFIFLVTPRTSEERLKKIASLSKSFVYLVSTSSTTGKRGSFNEEQEEGMKRVRQIIPDVPILTGFGIHDAKTREVASRYSNGVVVGTAFIRELEKNSIAGAVSTLVKKITDEKIPA